MHNNRYIFFLLHVALFVGALAFSELYLFFVFAALAGIIPRKRKNFGYYFLASLLAMAITLVLHIPETDLNKRLAALLGTAPVPFWVIVGMVTCLTLSITATAINSITLPANSKRRTTFSR